MERVVSFDLDAFDVPLPVGAWPGSNNCRLVAAATGSQAEAPARALQLLPRVYGLLSPPTEPAGTCVQAVLEASRPCAVDVSQTLVFKTVRLSADCCRVLAGVGDECVGPALLPVVNSVCGLVATIG
ncbi:unnamed protein product [Urochloa humidicola]